MNTKLSHIVPMQIICDEAKLCIAESQKHIPFEVKRVYFITDIENDKVRGKHAHKATKQVLYCIRGSVTVTLDNGREKEDVRLDKPDQGIFLDTLMWHEMHHFSQDALLVVFASTYFDESDYIRSYSDFKTFIQTL